MVIYVLKINIFDPNSASHKPNKPIRVNSPSKITQSINVEWRP